MKKLLLALTLSSVFYAGAQTLQTENFNSLEYGEVGTDITGVTPGQDGWLTFSSNGTAPTTATNAGAGNFAIIDNGFENTSGLLIEGSNGNKGSRFMWKPDFATLWATRDTGNEIIEIEYDMYTGGATASKCQYGVRLYGIDGTTSRVLNGFVYNADTRILQGVAYLNNAGTYGTFLVNLAAAPGLILEADTWYRIGFAYDTTSGELFWNTGAGSSGINAANWAGSFPVDEVDFVSGTPTANAEVSSLVFDNLSVKATATEALLNTAEIAGIEAAFSVYPNPAKDVITVTSLDVLTSVEFFDINGRVVKSVSSSQINDNTINISDLSAGVYMIKLTSGKDTETKKLIVE